MYKNPVPVSIGIIPSPVSEHILLIERADGGLALPGGYVDELEDSAQAVNREVQEETGLSLDASKWTLFFSAVTPDNKLLLFSFYSEAVKISKEFASNAEVKRVLTAPWRTPLRFSLHEMAIQKWLLEYSA